MHSTHTLHTLTCIHLHRMPLPVQIYYHSDPIQCRVAMRRAGQGKPHECICEAWGAGRFAFDITVHRIASIHGLALDVT